MTEIRIGRKKLVWPWILGICIVAILIYYIGFKDQTESVQANQVAVDLINVNEKNLTVAAFVRFMEEDTMKMELDNTFPKEALLKLVDATNSMAEAIHYDISSNMARVVKYVNRVMADPIETSNADSFREAADILTTAVLKSIQQAKYPALRNEIVELENACVSINPEVLILDQKDAVKAFFIKTTDLLRKMN